MQTVDRVAGLGPDEDQVVARQGNLRKRECAGVRRDEANRSGRPGRRNTPGLDPAAAVWLAESRAVDAVGIDTPSIDYGQSTGFESARMKPDLAAVQCEACHNMGTLHEPVGKEDQIAATCATCHDPENSPDFDLTAYLEKIRHW